MKYVKFSYNNLNKTWFGIDGVKYQVINGHWKKNYAYNLWSIFFFY